MFILLLCSCKTKDVARNTKNYERFTSDISALNERVMKDTTKTERVEQTAEFTQIYEERTIEEYDSLGNLKKRTKENKLTSNGRQINLEIMEEKGLEIAEKDSLENQTESDFVMESEETIDEHSEFWDSFGKWSGIGVIVIVTAVILWQWIKKILR